MPLTKVFNLTAKSSRITRSTGATAGNGAGVAAAVGRNGSYDYDAFLKCTIDWANVGTLVAARLVFYTEDASSIVTWSATKHPKVTIRLRKAAWTEGNSPTFATDEYTASNAYSTPAKSTTVVRTGLNSIDVLALVRYIRPTSAGGTLSTAQATTRSQMGFELNGWTDPDHSFALWTDDAEAVLRPKLELDYEPASTVPTVGTFSPTTSVASLAYFQAQYEDTTGTDLLTYSQVEVYTAAATNSGETVTGGVKVYGPVKLAALQSEVVGGVVRHVPNTTSWLLTNVPFKWRIRVYDSEGKVSLWSSLNTFTVTNTPPSAPTLSPSHPATLASMNVDVSTGLFADADVGDTLFAYEFQLSAFPAGDAGWETAALSWATGKQTVGAGATSVTIPYGGDALATGTYYLRGRVWDSRNAVSAWSYSTITLTADFEPLPGLDADAIQLRPRAPWRIRIREMKYNTVGGLLTGIASTNVLTTSTAHGLVVNQTVRLSALTGGAGLVVGTTYYVKTVPSTTTLTLSATKAGATFDFTTNLTATSTLTAVTTRGPGNTVAILENAKSVGATKLYNSPGEAHWTLPKDHPQISVIEPKLTHYAIDFRQGDGWREIYAGLVWDFDASDKDVVFTGLDYLALYDRVLDEKYNVAAPDQEAAKNGSKYVGRSISYIIGNATYGQLPRAKAIKNSPVGFIVVGAIATMANTLDVFSTYQRCLTFVAGLIDSYRAGNNRRTRITVEPTTTGYEVKVLENPGVERDALRLRYGELVQGYRVIPYGSAWATSVAGIGRSRDGIGVMYRRASAFSSDPSYEATFGHFMEPQFIDGVSDENDLLRRTKQAAVAAGTIGKAVGIGIRSNVLLPFDGYNLMDSFPVEIIDGPVDTRNWGSGYWNCVGVTWEASDNGSSSTVLTLRPREDGVAPSSDLLLARPISTQKEWQIGWTSPDPLNATSRYWLNQSTGVVSERNPGTSYPMTGTV